MTDLEYMNAGLPPYMMQFKEAIKRTLPAHNIYMSRGDREMVAIEDPKTGRCRQYAFISRLEDAQWSYLIHDQWTNSTTDIHGSAEQVAAALKEDVASSAYPFRPGQSAPLTDPFIIAQFKEHLTHCNRLSTGRKCRIFPEISTGTLSFRIDTPEGETASNLCHRQYFGSLMLMEHEPHADLRMQGNQFDRNNPKEKYTLKTGVLREQLPLEPISALLKTALQRAQDMVDFMQTVELIHTEDKFTDYFQAWDLQKVKSHTLVPVTDTPVMESTLDLV